MGFSEINIRAAEACIGNNIPFALYVMPGDNLDRAVFIASRPDENDDYRSVWPGNDNNWNGFFINYFGNDEEYTAGVRAEMDADSAITFASGLGSPYPPAWLGLQTSSTERLRHMAMVARVASRLKRDGGKTVLSRMEYVRVSGIARSLLEVAERYFAGFNGCFRYICYTRETGIWFGATPETVACIEGDMVSTMALAGTKSLDDDQPWDTKNRREHTMVVDYIVACLFHCGAKHVEKAQTGETVYSDIKHLITPIRARLEIGDYRRFLTTISPTPAVGGLPRDKALSEILVCEGHDRRCYGGFVGVKSGETLNAFANLRCAMAEIDPESRTVGFNIFSGGGITGASKPDSEWIEAVSKVKRLNEAIDSLANQL